MTEGMAESYKYVLMQTSEYQPDPKLVAAVQGLAEQIRHDARLARQAHLDFAWSVRAFFGPVLRALGGVGLIALIVLAEITRQHKSTK